MNATTNKRLLRDSILGAKQTHLTVQQSTLFIASEGESSTITLRVPSLCSGRGASSVMIDGSLLKRLVSAQCTADITLELDSDALHVCTQHSFITLVCKESEQRLATDPYAEASIPAELLRELVDQLLAVAMLRKTSLTIAITHGCLRVSTEGCDGSIACNCASGCWQLTNKDAAILLRLLRAQAKAQTYIGVLTTEHGLLLSCDQWEFELHKQLEDESSVVNELADEATGDGASVLCSDLRRTLSQVLAVGATDVRLFSRGKALSLSAVCEDSTKAETVTKCSGRVSATWSTRLLAAFLAGVSGEVRINDQYALTRLSVLRNCKVDARRPVPKLHKRAYSRSA